MVLNVRLNAAIEKRSFAAVCKDLADVADSNTLREAINRQLKVEDLWQHEEEFNASLAVCIPAAMPRAGLEMAIDFHSEPLSDAKLYLSRGGLRRHTLLQVHC